MKKPGNNGLMLFIILISGSIFLSSCYEGFTGPEGEMLLKYLQPAELKVLTESPVENIWLIDVRPRAAYQKGHIPTAYSFPSGEIQKRLNELPKDKYLILYCETGGRAQAVLNKLLQEGYTRLMNWGGFSRWPYTGVKS